MNKIAHIFTAKKAFFGSLVLAATILALLVPNAAVNVDEQLHNPQAQKVVNWYFTGGADKACLDTPQSNLKYYGQSVDNFAALIYRVFNIENEFLTRHYLGAFCFWLLLLFAGLLAFEITGSYWVSVLAVVSVLLMPRLFGQAFGNLKDIPFAAGYTASIYFLIRYIKQLPAPTWKLAFALAFSIAFTCSVRIGGLILLAYFLFTLGVFVVMKPFVPKQNVSTKPCLVRLLGQIFVIGIIGYFAGLLFWPFALQDVFRNPIASLHLMEHYKISIRQIFNGQMYWSTELPWLYLPKWILISTPGFVLLGALLYFVNLVNKIKQVQFKQLFVELFLVFSLLFPVVYVIVIDANLYSGVRQMLFVMPVFAVLAAIGIFRMFHSIQSKGIKLAFVFFTIFLMVLPLKSQVKTFPVNYVYFNAISGGAKKAWGNFEYDYYFHSFKKSSEYLTSLVGDSVVTVAGNCNLSNYFENKKNITYKYTRYLERSSADWDYAIFGLNYIHPELLDNGKWFSTSTVKVFFHEENPVAVILKRNEKTDFVGLTLAAEGNYTDAKILLENALNRDINNIWLIVELAKIALKTGDFESFNRYLQAGRNIYSKYEPLTMLEAQFEYNQGNFKQSAILLQQLLNFNSQYKPARKLLKEVNQKVNT